MAASRAATASLIKLWTSGPPPANIMVLANAALAGTGEAAGAAGKPTTPATSARNCRIVSGRRLEFFSIALSTTRSISGVRP